MLSDSLVTLAVFGRLFGTNGWIMLRSFTNPPDGLFGYPPPLLCTQGDDHLPIRFAEHKPHKDRFLVVVAGFATPERAVKLVNRQVCVHRDQLPPPQRGYYWHDLVGMRVCFTGNDHYDSCEYGTLTGFLPCGNQDVMRICPALDLPFETNTTELLIPFIEGVFVERVDTGNRVVLVNWPPSFF